jgi:hypothetical protein
VGSVTIINGDCSEVYSTSGKFDMLSNDYRPVVDYSGSSGSHSLILSRLFLVYVSVQWQSVFSIDPFDLRQTYFNTKIKLLRMAAARKAERELKEKAERAQEQPPA